VSKYAPSGLKAADQYRGVTMWPSTTFSNLRVERRMTSAPVLASQRIADKRVVVTTFAPSGLKATELTCCPPWTRVCNSAPVRASQSLAVPSPPPVATYAPSGLKATDRIPN
jgi:hypothetical protein